VEIHTFLTSALDGCEWSASRPGRFTVRERAPGTHLIGWVGPRARSRRCGEQKNSHPIIQRCTTELSWHRIINLSFSTSQFEYLLSAGHVGKVVIRLGFFRSASVFPASRFASVQTHV